MRKDIATNLHVILLAVAIPFLIPMYWMVISAFKTNADLSTLPPTLWPNPWTLHAIKSAVGPSVAVRVSKAFLSSSAAMACRIASTSSTTSTFARVGASDSNELSGPDG